MLYPPYHAYVREKLAGFEAEARDRRLGHPRLGAATKAPKPRVARPRPVLGWAILRLRRA